MRAFVTGASGFVGINLVKELLAQDWQVSILVRQSSLLDDLADLPVTISYGDITDADSLAAAIPHGVDAVFHVAASTNIWSANNANQTRTNVDGTKNVLYAALQAGAKRLIHVSSFVVYGFQPGTIDEATPRITNADWINYVATKYQAELLVRKAIAEDGLDAVIINPAHIMGPHDRHNWARMLIMVNKGKLPGVPSGAGSFADVREIARAAITAFHRGRTGQNYLLGGTDAAFVDVVRIAGKLVGKKVPARATPAWLIRAIARIKVLIASVTGNEPDLTPESAAMVTQHIMCDSSLAIAELGYKNTPIEVLVTDTYNWLAAEGLLNDTETN
jgi:nucleoside-diphosphate-sugar epimerase